MNEEVNGGLTEEEIVKLQYDKIDILNGETRFMETEHIPGYLEDYKYSVYEHQVLGLSTIALEDLFLECEGDVSHEMIIKALLSRDGKLGKELLLVLDSGINYTMIFTNLFDNEELSKLINKDEKIKVIGSLYPELVQFAMSEAYDNITADTPNISPLLINTIKMFIGSDSIQPIDTKLLIKLNNLLVI